MDTRSAIRKVCEALDWSQKELAAALDISPQAVSKWHRIPAERVLEVERLSGVPRHELRPDLYPPENQAAA